MNNTAATTVKVSPEVQARRDAATSSFKQKAHDLYHRMNGESAPCHNCGNIERSASGFQI